METNCFIIDGLINILRFLSSGTVEYLYYLSGPILAIFGVFAIFQLKVMRKTQIFNSTIELDKFYKDKISKSSNDISNILTINGVQIYEINVMGFETTNFHNEDITNYTKILLTNADQIKEHINNIELFATIIITTNDKKGIMYKTLRNQFVEDVEQIALFIAIINQNKQNKRSNNTIELYNDWKKPIKQNIILRSWNWIKITF